MPCATGADLREGPVSRARGQTAEELIEWACRHLQTEGRAWIRHTHPATSQDAQGRRFFKTAGAPDFLGFLHNGHGIVFDVKSTKEKRWRWTEGAGRRASTKARQLDDLVTAGRDYHALSGLLVIFWYPPQAAVWVPWMMLESVAHKSCTMEELVAGGGRACYWEAAMLPNFLTAALGGEPKP